MVIRFGFLVRALSGIAVANDWRSLVAAIGRDTDV